MPDKDQTCYAFIQLPGTFEWTVCGVLTVSEVGPSAYRGVFQYGRSYLARQNAPSLDPYNLPLSDRPQQFTKLKGIPGALRDASPDAWGRRVIQAKLSLPEADISEIDYLLNGPDDGAGNLLGSEQSGHIVGVGFELYCQLLRQSVARLKGDKQAAAIRATVKLDFVFVGEGESAPRSATGQTANIATSYQAIKAAHDEADGAANVTRIQARLPVAYIGETRLRLDFYRRLALAGSPATLKELESELTDRFGKFNS
ncbi:MAG: hypothetical protein EBX68_10200, partial [Betaproteobacteria bacterium]|nr:hypothetical protein [Betaproteobacteria bacterium]